MEHKLKFKIYYSNHNHQAVVEVAGEVKFTEEVDCRVPVKGKVKSTIPSFALNGTCNIIIVKKHKIIIK